MTEQWREDLRREHNDGTVARACCEYHRKEGIDVRQGFDVDLHTLATHQALAVEREALIAGLVAFIWPLVDYRDLLRG